MPEDETVESQELTEEQEAEAAFDEEAADEPEKDTETDETVEETEKTEESADDEKSEKSAETTESADDETGETSEKGESEEEQPAEKTARERVEERLKDVPDEEEEQQEPEKKAAPAAKDTTKGRLTKENVDTYLRFLSDDELPDGEMILGDRTVNFKELREEEPEIYDGIKVMSVHGANKIIQHYLNSGAIVSGKQVQDLHKKLDEATQQIDDLHFWNEVSKVHSNYHQVLDVKNKDFTDWLGGQSSKTQRLAKNLETPQDAILLIDTYNEDIAAGKAKEHDAKLAVKKKKTDDLHKHTMRQSKKAMGESSDEAINEEDEFAKEAEDLDKKERRQGI